MPSSNDLPENKAGTLGLSTFAWIPRNKKNISLKTKDIHLNFEKGLSHAITLVIARFALARKDLLGSNLMGTHAKVNLVHQFVLAIVLLQSHMISSWFRWNWAPSVNHFTLASFCRNLNTDTKPLGREMDG
jgi:hypothetical protein